MIFQSLSQLGYMGGGMSSGYMIIGFIGMLASTLVGQLLKSRFNKFSRTPIMLSGAEVAERMLAENGISDVQIISTPGRLTDHYNPGNKTVNLSDVVYNERNVAAAAVAAHEVGHAIQHATAYSWLTMRSRMVPVLSFGSGMAPWIISIGLGLMYSENALGPIATMIGIALFGLTTLFSVITLPVEFDASKRALDWIETSGVMGGMKHSQAKSALNAAAMTYVVSALASLAQLLYFIMRFMNAKRRN